MDARNAPEPVPLDPGLVPYLDYPVYVLDSAMQCYKTGCAHEVCADGEGWLWLHRRTTIRDILAKIKEHAEEARG